MREASAGCPARRDGAQERWVAAAHGAQRCPGSLVGSLQFGELAATLGPAGFVNASLLIKVMLPCASAQAVSGGGRLIAEPPCSKT